jgi:hypothetical protein
MKNWFKTTFLYKWFRIIYDPIYFKRVLGKNLFAESFTPDKSVGHQHVWKPVSVQPSIMGARAVSTCICGMKLLHSREHFEECKNHDWEFLSRHSDSHFVCFRCKECHETTLVPSHAISNELSAGNDVTYDSNHKGVKVYRDNKFVKEIKYKDILDA